MTTATQTIDVNVPLSVAYNQWTQMESYPRFMSGVESVQQLDDARTQWKMNVGGLTREYTAHITDQVPDSHIAWESEGEIKQNGRVRFEATGDDRCRVELSLEWEPEGLAENAGATMRLDDALVDDTLTKFKELIESQGFEEGAWRGEIHDGSAQRTFGVDDM